MNQNLKKLLVIDGLFFIITSYIAIFVNLYVWGESKSIANVILLNGVSLLSWTLFYGAGAKLLEWASYRLVMSLSAVFGLISFSLLSFWNVPTETSVVVCIAIPIGAMHGFFYAGKNLGVNVYGSSKEFTVFYGWMPVLNKATNVVSPLFNAGVIVGFGFTVSFLIMAIFIFGFLVLAYQIPNFKIQGTHIAGGLILTGNHLKWMSVSFVLAGVFRQFQSLFIILFTFTISDDILVVAFLNIFYTFISFSLMLFRKYFTKKAEFRWLAMGVALVATGFLISYFTKSHFLIVANIFIVSGMYFFDSIFVAQHFRMIKEEVQQLHNRLYFLREVSTNLTRVIFLTTLYLFPVVINEKFGVLFVGAMLCGGLIPFVQYRAFKTKKATGR